MAEHPPPPPPGILRSPAAAGFGDESASNAAVQDGARPTQPNRLRNKGGRSVLRSPPRVAFWPSPRLMRSPVAGPATVLASSEVTLLGLPEELIARIALAVDEPGAFVALRAVSRSLQRLLRDDGLWRAYFERRPWRPMGWWAEAVGVEPPCASPLPEPFASSAPWRAQVLRKASADAHCDRWHDFRPTPAAMLRAAHFAASGRRLHELWSEDEPSVTLRVVAPGEALGPRRFATLAHALAHVRASREAAAADGARAADAGRRSQVTVELAGGCVHQASADAPLLLEDPALTLRILGLPAPAPPVLLLAHPIIVRRNCRARFVNLALEYAPAAGAAAWAGGVPVGAAYAAAPFAVVVKGGVGNGARLELDDVDLRRAPLCAVGHGCVSARACCFRGAEHASAVTVKQHAEVALTHCALARAAHCGLSVHEHAYASLDRCVLFANARAGAKLVGPCCAIVTRSELTANGQMGLVVRDANLRARPPGGGMPLELAHSAPGAQRALVTAPTKVLARSAVRGNAHAGVAVIEHGALTLQASALEANGGPGLLVQHDGYVEVRANVLRGNAEGGLDAAARGARAGPDAIDPRAGSARAPALEPGAREIAISRGAHEIVLSHAAVLVSRDVWDARAAQLVPSAEARRCRVFDEAQLRRLREPRATTLADVGDFLGGGGADDDRGAGLATRRRGSRHAHFDKAHLLFAEC